MEPGSTVSTKAARALLLVLFAANVYRAAMQSITPPEAATYNRFVGPNLANTLSVTTANNHVLNTLLARISTSIFHLTDLSLRLPSLLGGLLYFWAVLRLARRTFGTGPLYLAAVALLSINPLVLDYLSMARGYGLALAFWMWGLELMLEYLELNEALREPKLNLAGACLGLSVAANLAFLVPAVALATAFSVHPTPRQSSRRFQDFWLPAVLTAFLILVIPFNHADFATFNYGATSLRQTLNSLTALSLLHGDPSGLPPWVAAVVRVGVAVVALLVAVPRRGRPGGLLYLLAGTILLGFAGLELGHRVLKIPFPLGRSGLYFIPVFTLAGLCLIQRINWRPVEWAVLLVSGVYILQFNLNLYGEWPEYVNARSVVKAIRQDAGRRALRVAASPGLDQVLNYYRARYALGAWVPVQPGLRTASFDYYALSQEDVGLVQEQHLHVVWRDGNLTVAR